MDALVHRERGVCGVFLCKRCSSIRSRNVTGYAAHRVMCNCALAQCAFKRAPSVAVPTTYVLYYYFARPTANQRVPAPPHMRERLVGTVELEPWTTIANT